MTPSRSSRRGFSLIEAAIVLGIIGLVMGGIWVATSHVRFTFRVNGLMVDVGKMQNKLKRFKWTAALPIASSGTALRDMGVIPKNFSFDGVAYTDPNTALQFLAGVEGGSPLYFHLYLVKGDFTDIPSAECTQIVLDSVAFFGEKGIQSTYIVSVDSSTSFPLNTPTTVDAATTACASGAGFIEYKLPIY